MNHATLLAQVANGDEGAFRTLYEAFKTRVFNTALSYLQNREEAEEVTQDVFVEVFESAGRFAGNAAVGTWLYRIAVNKSLDRLRHQKRKKRFALFQQLFHTDTGQLLHEVPHFDHPGVQLEQQENARLLFQTLDRLPEAQKTAFILSFIEELPRNEVAEVMRLSLKAVESLLQRAKANLRSQLENMHPERRK